MKKAKQILWLVILALIISLALSLTSCATYRHSQYKYHIVVQYDKKHSETILADSINAYIWCDGEKIEIEGYKMKYYMNPKYKRRHKLSGK